jgi:hypothetical protein
MTIDVSLLKKHYATGVVVVASLLLAAKNVIQHTHFWRTGYEHGTIPVFTTMLAVYGFLFSVACVHSWFCTPRQERHLTKLLLVLPMFLYGMAAVLFILVLILRFLFP